MDKAVNYVLNRRDTAGTYLGEGGGGWQTNKLSGGGSSGGAQQGGAVQQFCGRSECQCGGLHNGRDGTLSKNSNLSKIACEL